MATDRRRHAWVLVWKVRTGSSWKRDGVPPRGG